MVTQDRYIIEYKIDGEIVDRDIRFSFGGEKLIIGKISGKYKGSPIQIEVEALESLPSLELKSANG